MISRLSWYLVLFELIGMSDYRYPLAVYMIIKGAKGFAHQTAVRVKVCSRTFLCQLSLSKIKTRKNVHYMFQTNPAVKQTERLYRHSLELDEFLARETMWPRLFSRPLYTCVFQEISCVLFLISFLLCRLFFMEFR